MSLRRWAAYSFVSSSAGMRAPNPASTRAVGSSHAPYPVGSMTTGMRSWMAARGPTESVVSTVTVTSHSSCGLGRQNS